MFENTDDEDAFFAPVKSSNLASLFGVSMSTESSTSSLTYTPPKQPQKNQDDASKGGKSKQQSSIVVFKEVHAFKLSDKNYQNQGRVGLALIGNEETKTYQLLLYRQKTDIISCSKMNGSFQFLLQKENHATFTDDQKCKWTIRFNTEPDLSEFVRALEARGARVSSLTNKPEPAAALKPELLPKKCLDVEPEKDCGDTDGTVMKASILSRMAKMGQKVVLPQTPTSVTEGSDSDSDARTLAKQKKNNNRRSTATEAAVRNIPIVQPSQFMLVNGQYIPVLPQQSVVVPVSNSLPIPAENAVANSIGPLTEQLNVFFAENRTHNSEVRMNVVRLTNKMEDLLEKVNKIGADGRNTTEVENEREERRRLEATALELEKKCRELAEKNRELVTEHEAQLEKLKTEKADSDRRAEQSESELQGLQAKLQEIESRNASCEDVEDMLKKIMNAFYYELGSEFKDDSVFYGADVKKVLAPKIVEKTYRLSSKVADLIKSKTCS